MKYKIIKDKNFLKKPTSPVSSIEEGEEIASKLREALSEIEGYVGHSISANQIGISKSVSLVQLDGEELILINPKITYASQEKLLYTEACPSVPGKILSTVRHKSVTVECLNWANPITFKESDESEDDPLLMKKFTSNISSTKNKVNIGLLRCICVQHEIDHLNGKLITDDTVKFNRQVLKVIVHGRNDKVMIEKNGLFQSMKYKKAELLLEDGWKIV